MAKVFDRYALLYQRQRAGLTQAQLAERMGYRNRSGAVIIGRYERGVQTPQVQMQARLARALGCEFADLRTYCPLAPHHDAYTLSGSPLTWAEWVDSRGGL